MGLDWSRDREEAVTIRNNVKSTLLANNVPISVVRGQGLQINDDHQANKIGDKKLAQTSTHLGRALDWEGTINSVNLTESEAMSQSCRTRQYAIARYATSAHGRKRVEVIARISTTYSPMELINLIASNEKKRAADRAVKKELALKSHNERVLASKPSDVAIPDNVPFIPGTENSEDDVTV